VRHHLREEELAESIHPIFQQFAPSSNKARERENTPPKDNKSV
jgi:hypothetical protein